MDTVVPAVSVTLTDQATGGGLHPTCYDSGLFRVLNLRPGTYAVKVEMTGFRALEMNNIALASSENRDLGRLVMRIGSITDEVSVTAQATPVQTGSSERSESIPLSSTTSP